MANEEVIAPATPASSSGSLSSRGSPIINENVLVLPPFQSLALEFRLPGRGLFSSLTGLLDALYQRGRGGQLEVILKK
jgi:hypothetical protein